MKAIAFSSHFRFAAGGLPMRLNKLATMRGPISTVAAAHSVSGDSLSEE
jgi:hypothetical protein